MPAQQCDVLVVGAGVIGLTTAICLAENGLDVEVRTAEPTSQTTSAVAGAIWGPFLSDDSRVYDWSFTSLEVLDKLAQNSETGVTLVSGVEATKERIDFPEWFDEMPEAQHATEADLPPGYLHGYRYQAPVVDMPVYLEYLIRRLEAARSRITFGRVTSLLTAAEQARVVVNCTGLQARELVPDPSMKGLYGRLVVVENPGLTDFFIESGEDPQQTYLLPQGPKVVLGGTVEPEAAPGAEYADSAAAIQRRCAEIVPELASARILHSRGALRPYRSAVRLEHEEVDGKHIIHNYGHGGSGVSLSWACAVDVRNLIDALT